MCLVAESLVGMLELMQMQQHRPGETVTVFCVGVGDGREQMAIAAACSARDARAALSVACVGSSSSRAGG